MSGDTDTIREARHGRDYLERTIATVRIHRGADNSWPQWANIFADEIESCWQEIAAVEAQRDELARALRVIAPAADEACVILRSLAASMERDELSSPALRQRIRDAAVALRAALAAAGDAE